MPEIGEIIRGKDRGLSSCNYMKCIWLACETCGEPRWVQQVRGKPVHKECSSCASRRRSVFTNSGVDNINWRGGRCVKNGYIHLWVSGDDFFAPMKNNRGYVPEHRLVMAQSLGRCLEPWEVIHHKNHVRDDNCLSNLELMNDFEHKQFTALLREVEVLRERVRVLEEKAR